MPQSSFERVSRQRLVSVELSGVGQQLVAAAEDGRLENALRDEVPRELVGKAWKMGGALPDRRGFLYMFSMFILILIGFILGVWRCRAAWSAWKACGSVRP